MISGKLEFRATILSARLSHAPPTTMSVNALPANGTTTINIATPPKRKKKATVKHQTMFTQFTPQKKITVPYRLNKDKQLLRLQKSLNSASDLSMDQFKFSRMRLSATVKNVHPFVFKTLGNVASKFCGMNPKCAEHGTFPFTFTAQENWAMVNLQLW